MATTLTTYAVIQGVDRLTGPFQGMARNVRMLNSQLNMTGQRLAGAGRAMTYGFTLPAAMGMAAVLREAKEFSKFELGVSVAQLGDNTDEAANGFARIKKVTGEIRADVLAMSRSMGVSPTRLMAGAEAAVKMNLRPEVSADYARRAAQLGMIDPEFPIEQATELLGTIATTYKYVGADAEEQRKRIGASAEMLAYTANKSRLSVGTLQEGIRQFLPLASMIGMDEATAYAMTAGAVNSGFNATEIGTALKSGIIKALVPTRKGMGVLDTLGISRGDYMDFSAARPADIMAQLKYLNKGMISGKEEQGLLTLLREGSAAKMLENPDFTEKFLARLFKATGAVTEEDRASVEGDYWNSVNAGGGKFDFWGFFKALGAKGITPAQMSQLFDMRQAARLGALKEQIGFVDDLRNKLTSLKGDVLQGGESLYRESLFGRMERTAAAWEALSISLAASPAMESVANALTSMSEGLASLDPSTLNALTKIVLGLAVAGPATWALGNSLRLLSIAGGGLRLLGTDFKMLASARSAMALGDMATGTRLLAGSFSLLRMSLIGAAVAAAGCFAYQNWDTITEGASRFTKTFSKELDSPLLKGQLIEFKGHLSEVAKSIERLTGWELPRDAQTAWFGANEAAARHLANALTMALAAFNALARALGSAPTTEEAMPAGAWERGHYRPVHPISYNKLTGGVLDNPSLENGPSSTPFSAEQMNEAKGPIVAKVNLDTLKAWLQGVINVRVTGKVDGATTTTTVSGALSGDASKVKLNTGVSSVPDLGGGGL